MTDTPELLPCPLLGHEPLGDSDTFGPGPYVSVSGAPDKFYAVICPGCCSTAYSGSREGAIKLWNTRTPSTSPPAVDSQPAEYVRGVRDAARIARDEFARSPEAARDHDSVWMGGYEDACDHLSIEIEKLTEGYSTPPDLEWAAQWIEGSLKGETNERVIEFGRNMVMTFRAALLPTDARPQPVASEPKENDDRRL